MYKADSFLTTCGYSDFVVLRDPKDTSNPSLDTNDFMCAQSRCQFGPKPKRLSVWVLPIIPLRRPQGQIVLFLRFISSVSTKSSSSPSQRGVLALGCALPVQDELTGVLNVCRRRYTPGENHHREIRQERRNVQVIEKPRNCLPTKVNFRLTRNSMSGKVCYKCLQKQ